MSLIIYTVVLAATGIAGVFLFGSTIKSDLLNNLGTRTSGLSIFIRVIYFLVLLFHLPYVFFALKEYVLVMYEEIESKKLSTHLEAKL